MTGLQKIHLVANCTALSCVPGDKNSYLSSVRVFIPRLLRGEILHFLGDLGNAADILLHEATNVSITPRGI